MYQIKYEDFEGPMDLLLELFEKKKLDITKLSLAKVADDYLAYIEDSRNINLANLSDFLLIASQLILIKSKALLPLFEFTQEEENEIEDLQTRLLEYQKFKKTSEFLGERLTNAKKCFPKQEKEKIISSFVPPRIEKEQLAQIFNQVQAAVPKEEQLTEEIMKEIISLEEKISQIKCSLENRMKMAFTETIKNTQDKIEVIVSFLAMLEMIKQKMVSVQQEDIFSEIQISRRSDEQI